MISAHVDTNSLVITAPPDVMRAMKDVIAQLDIRRAQVLIEALIVELAEGDGVNLGVQWGNLETGAMIQYSNTGASIGATMVGLEEAKGSTTTEKKFMTQQVIKLVIKILQKKVAMMH